MVSTEYLGRPAGGSSTALLDFLTKVGSVADLPASVIRDLLGGQGLGGSFDQLLTPMSPENRLTGGDLLQKAGLDLGSGVGGMLGGMTTEALLDPLTLAGGLGMAYRQVAGGAGTRAHRALQEMAERVGPQYRTQLSQIGLPGQTELPGASRFAQEGGNTDRVRRILGQMGTLGEHGARGGDAARPGRFLDELLTEIPEGSQIVEWVDADTLRIKAPPATRHGPKRELLVSKGPVPQVENVTRSPAGRVAGVRKLGNSITGDIPGVTIADMGPWRDVTHEISMPETIPALNPLRGLDSAGSPIPSGAPGSLGPLGGEAALNLGASREGLLGAAREADQMHLTRAAVGGIDPGSSLFLNRQGLEDLTEGGLIDPMQGLLSQMNEELARRGPGRLRASSPDIQETFDWDPGITDYMSRADEAPFEAMAISQGIPRGMRSPNYAAGQAPNVTGRPVSYAAAADEGGLNAAMVQANRTGYPMGGSWPTDSRGASTGWAMDSPAKHSAQLSEVLMRSQARFPDMPTVPRQALPTKDEILQRHGLPELLLDPEVATPVLQPDGTTTSPLRDWAEEMSTDPLARRLIQTRVSMDQLASNMAESGLENADFFSNYGSRGLAAVPRDIPMIDNLLAGKGPLRNAYLRHGHPADAFGTGQLPTMPIEQYAEDAIRNWQQLSPIQQQLLRMLGYLNPARGKEASIASRALAGLDDVVLPASLAALTGGATAQGFSRANRQQQRQGQRQY